MTTVAQSPTQDYSQSEVPDRLPTWKVIWKTIQFRRKIWLLNLLAMIFLMLAAQIPGLAIREFFNLLSGDAPAGLTVWTLVAFLLAGEIARNLGGLGLSLTNVPFFVNIMTMIRRNLLRYVLKKPGARALPDSPGESISRFRRDVFEIPLFDLWINDILGLVVFTVIALAIMMSINPFVTLVALVPFFVVGLIANLTAGKIETYRRASRKWTGSVVGFIGETFGAVQAVKVASSEEGVMNHFKELNEIRRVVALKDRLFNEILHSIFVNAVNIGTAVILILSGQAIQEGNFTVGDFALFVFYLEFVSDLTAFSGLVIARYRQIGVSIERMTRLMEGAPHGALLEFDPIYLKTEPPHPEQPKPTPADKLETLTAQGLTFHYESTSNGITDVDLNLKRCSFTVITGRIGSGKTTLLRVLLGLLARDSGEIYWNDQPIHDAGAFFVPPRTAYTGQVPRLFSDPLRDNILLGLLKSDDEIMPAVRSAVMEHDVNEFDDGLGTMVGPKGVKLSGGQIQRSAAARMFTRVPELLVFDDLSSALDVETERVLWERVFEADEVTCLVVSHRKAALSHANHIIVMKDGRIHAEGQLDDLLESNAEFQRLWHGEG